MATPAFAEESDAVVVHRADNGPAVITVESEGKPVTVSQIVAANTSFEKVGTTRLPAQRGVATQTPQIGGRGAF